MGPVFVWFWVGARLKTEGVVSEGSSAPTAGGPLDAQAVAVINVSGRLDYEHAHSLDRRSEGFRTLPKRTNVKTHSAKFGIAIVVLGDAGIQIKSSGVSLLMQ